MRLVTISVLSVFVALPALADVRLPVVNLASGGVSARAAFGEPIVKSTPVARTGAEKSVALAQETNKKTEVVKPESEPVSVRATSIDRGEQIVASADILAPRRPSSDLWAHAGTSAVDMPLRLPNPSEFSVIRSDAMLPEESLNDTPVRTAVASAPAHDVMPSAAPLSELDAQIARLNELQQRADASVSDDARVATAAPRSVVPRPTVVRPAASHTESGTHTTKIASVRRNNASDTDVNLSRMVVPMDDDVIVRAVEKSESPRIASVRNDMTGMSPSELRRAFRKTFLSENKHLSTFQIDDRFDVVGSFNRYFKDHGLKSWDINADFHWNVYHHEYFEVYPLVGLSFLHQKWGDWDDSFFGVNIGGGIMFNITDAWKIGAELKGQIMSDSQFVPLVTAMYRF